MSNSGSSNDPEAELRWAKDLAIVAKMLRTKAEGWGREYPIHGDSVRGDFNIAANYVENAGKKLVAAYEAAKVPYQPILPKQEPLGAEFQKVLDDNFSELLVRDWNDKPNEQPVELPQGLKATSSNGEYYQCKICGGNPTEFPYTPDPKLHSPNIGGKVGRAPKWESGDDKKKALIAAIQAWNPASGDMLKTSAIELVEAYL